jgi:tyrosinase
MRPTSYLTPYPDHYGSYTLQGGGKINDTLSTPLQPFSTDKQGHVWTSSSAQSLRGFGYSYPEIQDWNQTPDQLQTNVTAQVNALYGPSASKIKGRDDDLQVRLKEWSVRISVSKFDLSGERFIVHTFLGDIPHDPSAWSVSDNCVGSFPILPPVSHAASTRHQVPTHNEFSLTEGLKTRGYDGQNSILTAEFLERSLQWKVQLVCLPTQFPSYSTRKSRF